MRGIDESKDVARSCHETPFRQAGLPPKGRGLWLIVAFCLFILSGFIRRQEPRAGPERSSNADTIGDR